MDEQRAWIKSRRRKRLRIVAVVLCVCLLATTCPDILTALSTLATEWVDSTVYVSSFGELPVEVREQTVPLGTGEEELALPNTLEAFAAAPEDKDSSGDANGEDTNKPGDAEDGKGNQPEKPEDGTGEPGDGTGDAGSTGEESGSGDTGNADEGNGGAGESGEGNGDVGNPGEETEGGTGDIVNPSEGNGGAGESGDGTGDAGNTAEESDGGSSDAGNTGEESDGGNTEAETSDGTAELDGDSSDAESQNDSTPVGDAEDAGETAKGNDGELTVQRGVFFMPVYMAEPEASSDPQTMEREEESVMIKGVTWQSEPAYDGNVEGTYVFTAVLPEGYTLAEGVSLPQITVTVQETDSVTVQETNPVVQELLTRITVLPEAEDYLVDEPDVEAEEEYEAWMDELSAYTAEALELWEMYEALTEEQRALIPTEAFVKLAAWVELAGQLAEGIAVTAEAQTVTITVNLWRNGSRWSGQKIELLCDETYYSTNETNSGVYTGTVVKGGDCYACLNGSKSGIGGLSVPASQNNTLTFRYVTVTYKNDGATGDVPEEESFYCGRVNRTTPRTYTVKTDLSLTKPGYVQTGWSETSGGNGEKVTEITVNPGTGDEASIRTTPIVLYPVFTPAAVTINATNCTHNGAAEVGGSGDYTVTFTPGDGYHVPQTVTVQIGGKELGSDAYTYTNGKLTISRSKITGNVTITANASSEHSLTYTADTTQGTITESCKNGCGHSVTAGFKTTQNGPYVYNGNAIKPFAVNYTGGSWLGTTKPVISYTNNTAAGTATATLSRGSVSVSRTFTIAGKPLTDNSITVTLSSTSYQYTGNEIRPAVTVKDGSKTLTAGTDYTVTYQNNTAVSTDTSKAQVVIMGKGNYAGERRAGFTIQDSPPDVTLDGLDIDYSGGTVKLPDDIKDQVEIYDSDGKKITPNADGSLPVEPGSIITIKYPGSNKETVITIPGRHAASAPKKVTVTDTTATVSDPADGEEYVLVARGGTPDWSIANTTGAFKGLTPNTAYDLYVRKQATTGSFASEPAKTQIRTNVTIKEPETDGAGAGKEGNDVSEGKPSADGDTVTYTGTCEEGSTPVIIIDGEEIIPEITWDEDGRKGTWSYTVPVEDGKSEVGIRVEFRDRAYTRLEIAPDNLHIYADDTANQSADKLINYLKAHCTVKAIYDNGTSDDATNGADYTADREFNVKGGVTYEYALAANADVGKVILTVSPVTVAIKTTDVLMQTPKSGGYTKEEVDAWLPKEVTVTYTGADGYAQRSESRPVTWKTDALDAGFGAAVGSKTIGGTVALPEWATGENTVSIEIGFVDRNALTDAQMNLSISGWAYGAQTTPAPEGSVTVTDTEQTYTYRYRAESSTSWVTADELPKSGSGNIIPGDYLVEMTYTGKNYTGTKTAAFTVVQKPVTAEKGTLAVENRNYDGTTKATLKADGKPALVGVIENDDVALGGTLEAVFTDKGPKKDIPVTVTGFVLTGSESGYYKLVNTTLTLKAAINNEDGDLPSGSGDNGDNVSGGDSRDNGNSGNSGNTGTGGNGGNSGIGGSNGSGGNNGGNTSGTGGVTGTGSNNGTSGTGKGTISSDSTRTGGGGKDGAGNGNSSSSNSGTDNGTGNGDAGAQRAESEWQTKSVTVQTVQAAADDGRIVISGETEAPVVIGTLTEDAPGATRLLVGEGTVTVTVVCEDDQYTVGINDAAAVANAVLTLEQIQHVDEGESLEIRVDIKNISQSIPPQDRETVEKGYEAYGKYLPELTRGGYVDISVYIKTGDGGWNAVAETTEPLEIVIGIPEELWGDGREYYIIRAHEGRYALLNDMDAVPETITIVTDLFSSYAIAYREADGADRGNGGIAYGLFHISPKFLGIVSLIWLTVAVAGIIIVIIVLRRKKSGEKEMTV
ncbi:MAG: hypothetical protein K2N80_04635 [Lachnospiraceae bacterium]|nr:hypothetical protein [Lachnospiraceae bacterium]